MPAVVIFALNEPVWKVRNPRSKIKKKHLVFTGFASSHVFLSSTRFLTRKAVLVDED